MNTNATIAKIGNGNSFPACHTTAANTAMTTDVMMVARSATSDHAVSQVVEDREADEKARDDNDEQFQPAALKNRFPHPPYITPEAAHG